jgi:propanol-preferring alcohol dehydrogenase
MINIKGSYVGNRQDGVEAVDFFARGLINAPFKTAQLKDLPEVFKLMGTFQIFRLHDIDFILIL